MCGGVQGGEAQAEVDRQWCGTRTDKWGPPIPVPERRAVEDTPEKVSLWNSRFPLEPPVTLSPAYTERKAQEKAAAEGKRLQDVADGIATRARLTKMADDAEEARVAAVLKPLPHLRPKSCGDAAEIAAGYVVDAEVHVNTYEDCINADLVVPSPTPNFFVALHPDGSTIVSLSAESRCRNIPLPDSLRRVSCVTPRTNADGSPNP